MPKKEHKYFVYIATNKNNTVLYTGVTNNIIKRGYQHKEKLFKNSFTAKYNVNKIVYYEFYQYINDALTREKQIKNLLRRKKIELIKKNNKEWKDLIKEMFK